MCLGTFSRRAQSLATFFIFVRVPISGTQCLLFHRKFLRNFLRKKTRPHLSSLALEFLLTQHIPSVIFLSRGFSVFISSFSFHSSLSAFSRYSQMFRATYPDYNTVRAHIRSDRSFPMQIALSDPYRHHLHEPLLPRQGKYDATPAFIFCPPYTRC